MTPYNPLPFADVQDLHRELGGGMSLVDFAKTANRATGSNMFDSAVGNPFSIGIKRASSGLDRFLDEYAGPVNETLGEGGAWLFDTLGADPEFGRQVGEEALRSLVDFVPALAGFAAAAIPGVGAVSIPAGLAATAAMSGANAYEKTDSELMGLTSAALAGFGGKLTEYGATTALRGAAKIPALKSIGISGGAKQVVQRGDEVVEQLIAKQVGDRVLGAVAGESFVNTTGLLAEAGVGLVETGQWENPFTLNNMLAEVLDPTLLFGVKELVHPSVISQKVIQHSDELKQFTNADTEEATRRMGDVVPDMVGSNAAEIERAYRDLRMQAEAIKDKEQKKAVLVQLEKARAQAREKTATLEPGAAQTLFGEALVTKLDEELFTPKTVDTVDENGQVVKEEVTLEKILSPEELASYRENLSDILSPQSMIRLAELSEMDTPKTENEFRDTIVQMNAVRAELERGMVDDAWLRKKITEKTDQGDSVEVATEKAWQVAKNETEGMVEAKKRPNIEQEDKADTLWSRRIEALLAVPSDSLDKIAPESEVPFSEADIIEVATKLNLSTEEATDLLEIAKQGLTKEEARVYLRRKQEALDLAQPASKTVNGIAVSDQDTSAYHYGDLNVGRDTVARRMDSGRGTGHLGTGVYFLGSKNDALARADRPVHNLDLEKLNLAKVQPSEGIQLHDALRDFNRTVWKRGNFESITGDGRKSHFNLSVLLGIKREVEIKEAMLRVQAIFDNKQDDGIRIPSTYLMQELGYDGIDLRGTNADNGDYGSVIFYKPGIGNIEDYAKPSLTETDPDIVKAKEAVEDVEEEEWRPTDWSKLPKVREIPNSPEGIVGKLKAVEERKMKRPTGGRKNPVLDAPDVEEPSTSAAFDKMVDDLIGADEIEYFSGLDQEQQSLLLASREEALFESARVETRNELFRRTLAKDGSMSNKAIEASLPTFEKLFNMFDGDDVQLFEILDGSVRGAATTKGAVRKLFLGDKGLEGLDDASRVFATSFVTAHELGHNSQQLYKEGLLSQRHWDAMDQNTTWFRDASREDRKLALELLRDGMIDKKYRDSDVVRLAMEALDDPAEVQANAMAFWAMGQLHKPDGVAMNLLPGPVRKGLEVLSDLYHSVVSAFRGLSSFDLMFKNRQATRAQLDKMSNMMKTWKKELNKSQDFYTEAQGLLTVGPAAYRDTLAFFGKKDDIDRTSVLPHDTRGLLTKAFDEWIMPFDQLTQMVPQFRGIAADLHNYTGDVRAALNRIAGMVAGEVTSEGKVSFANRTVKMEWKQVRDDKKLNKLASNWMRAQQEAPGLVVGKGRKLSFEDLKEFSPDTHKQLVALPEKQRKAVINVVTRMGKAMEKLQSEVLNVVNASNESMVMSYIANKMPELRKDAPGLAQVLNRGIRDIKSNDPAVVQAGQLMLSQVATKLGPEQFYKAYDIAAKAADSYEKLNVELKSTPHFFSEMRFGKHFLHWTRPDGTSGGLAFDSLKDARAKEKQLRDSGASVTREDVSRGTAARLVGRDQLLDRLEEFDERGKALVDVLDLDDETKRILKTEFNSRWEFLRDVNAAKIVEPGSKRHLAEGREDLDMIQTQMLYFQVAMRTLNKKLLNHRLNYRFSDPELNDPKVMAMRPQLESMIKNFFTPDTELGRGISTFNAGYFLGGNLSSHLLELMQAAFSFVPELINRKVGFLEAQKMTLKAMMEVGMFTAKHIPSAFGRMVKRRLPEGRHASQAVLEGRDDNTLWSNAEYGAVMEYAASRGKINLGHASDEMNVDIENNVDITNMLGKGRADSHPFKKYGISPAMEMVRFPLKFYQQFTEFNARVSLILGYELAKKRPGVSKQRAIEEAFEFSNTVTFSGGKLNRPNQLFTGEGTYRTVGQALYSLNGYTFGMLGMMRRYAETGYSSKQFPGLTSEQRKAARKSLKTILATQFLGAGALGMPFVGAAMTLMEKLTGVEFEREMREGLAELFKEDEEDEGLLSDAVMHGAANAILGSMLPGDPDLGSRFDIGGVMGINSFNGFTLDQLFGPTGSVIKNVVNGSTEVARGNVAQGFIDMAPVALKRVLETIKNEGELRDRNGALLIDATFGEKISNAVGFAPQRVKKMRNNERLQARHEEKMRTDMIRKFDDLAKMYMENPTGLKEAVRDIADNDPKVQLAREMGDRERAKVEFIASQRAAAAKIAERLEKKIFPKDSGRTGTLRGTYGESTGTGQVTEVARMQLKAQVEQNLGLQPSLTQRSMQRAAIIDRLMQQNPGLGRPEAAARADLLLARL